MNKFNLTFWGEIQPGRDPATVKARFARLFDIQDQERLEHFFSGEIITLRRNLERKVAAEYFAKLHKLGVEAELVKVDPSGAPAAPQRAPRPGNGAPESSEGLNEWEQARRQAELEVIHRAELDSQARKREAQERRKLEEARAEEERLFRERQAELERERQEQLARREAEKEAERQRREEEAQRVRAEQEERRRLAAEEEERRRAEREEQRRLKAEEAERRKAEAAAEAELRRAEEAARLLEEKERQQRIQQEEALRREEEQAERERLREEREVRQREEREAQRRLKAEQAARRRAEALAAAEERKRTQEQRRRERELQIAARKAEREAARLAAEEEATRQRVQREEQQRQQAAEAARLQALREVERREREEAAARRKAELAAAREQAELDLARKKAEAAERKRLHRESARQAAARREREKQAAAEQAGRERAQAEQERKRQEEARRETLAREKAAREAEAAREREALAARQREEEARRRAEREEQARKRAEEKAAREQARAEEKARREAEREAEVALERARAEERQRLEEQAIARGAAALAEKPGLKSGPARVKSSLDLPRREKSGQVTARRRQPGAPNDYQTRPFRNTAEVRQRPEIAALKLRRGLGVATLVLAVSLLLVGRYISIETPPVQAGPDRIVATAGGQLLIQAGDRLLLHDRAGMGETTIEAARLQLARLSAPMGFTQDRRLLLRAATAGDPPAPASLWHCDLAALSCDEIPGVNPGPDSALQVHPLTGQWFIADPAAGSLSKLEADGSVSARAELPLAPRPALVLDSGLLFMNSHEGPAVSVRRYEDQAFASQLDEVLLLPPPALENGQVQVHDFLRAGDRWWVSMTNPDNGSAGLYIFDDQWKYLSQVALPGSHLPALLAPWGPKVLVTRPDTPRVLRFSATGTPEADLESDLLLELIASQQRWRSLLALGWSAVFSLCLVAAAVSLAFTYIQYLRRLVYRGRTTRGAEPLDQFSRDLDWADPLPDRDARLRRTAITYALLCLGAVLLLAAAGASASHLGAALLALAGPATGLYLYWRGAAGHAGVSANTLALVDHRDVYHLGADARIQYRGPFLLIDDVVVFTGTALLPALSPAHVEQKLKPVYQGGARVDRKTVLVKLGESRHPLALAALSCALCALAAAVVLLAGNF